MDKDMKRLCTICARGGSKGLPGKNIRPLLGKPLIAWTVEQALQSGQFLHVAVSSNDEAILEAARRAGATLIIKRPEELATDTVSKLPAIVTPFRLQKCKLVQPSIRLSNSTRHRRFGMSRISTVPSPCWRKALGLALSRLPRPAARPIFNLVETRSRRKCLRIEESWKGGCTSARSATCL